jgi:hypothetical protein
MGQYLGSWAIDDYLTIPAVTHRFSTGAAYAASPITVRIYEDDNTTQIITDQAMTAFDSVTGLYVYKQQLTAAAGFEQGKSYTAVIQATVDTVAAIDFHTFQIAADVTATATVAGTVDANVIQVSGHNVPAHGTGLEGYLKVDVGAWRGTAAPAEDTAGYPKVTIKDGTGQGELNIDTGRADSNITYWGGVSAGTLAAASDVWNDASCPTRILTAPTNITSDDGEIHNSASGVYITSTGHTAGATVAAVTGNVGGNVVGTVASVGTVTGNVNGNVGGNVAGNVTGSVGSVAAGGIIAASIASNAITADKIQADAIGTSELSDSAVNKIADGILGRELATGDADALEARTVRSALRAIRNKFDIVGTTMTVCKEDDTATAWTTEITRAAVFPITGSNPT